MSHTTDPAEFVLKVPKGRPNLERKPFSRPRHQDHPVLLRDTCIEHHGAPEFEEKRFREEAPIIA